VKPPPLLIRRAVVDPVWPPLAVVLAAVLLIVALLGALAAPLSRRRRPLRLGLFGALYVVLDAVLVICCAAVWLRHPLRGRRDEARWSQLHEVLLRTGLSLLVGAARTLLGFRLDVQEPPDQQQITGRPLLVLARHGGPGDSFALAELLLSRYQRRPLIVAKQTLRWVPALDVLLGRLPSCFVRGGDGSKVSERLAALATNMRPEDAILLFPEGRNWTPLRHSRAIARLHLAGKRQAAADAAEHPNVLPPQPGGLLGCFAARPDLDVAIVAHTGLDDLVSLALVWRSLPVDRPMTVRWWYVAAATLPRSDEGQREWLRLQWASVDAWIDGMKADRRPGGGVSVSEGGDGNRGGSEAVSRGSEAVSRGSEAVSSDRAGGGDPASGRRTSKPRT
jgi:1-acyl-sn-glycerol-3-phosphate acyltransferase